MRADLHCHSTASDGVLSPRALIAEAVSQSVELLALTDHDSVAGLQEAADAAADNGLAFVPGIEISVSWENRTLHIVGLNIDPQNSTLTTGLQGLQALRAERAETMARKLEKCGLHHALERGLKLANNGQLTRTHFARLLVEDGLVADMKQAFRRYLADGKPAYVKAQWASLPDAIEWIHAAGGLAVLAHPLRYKFSGAWRERMLVAFKAAGGDALEVSCGASQNPQDLSWATRAALKHGLLASMGSDFHGEHQQWLKLGKLAPLSSQLQPIWEVMGYDRASLSA